MAQRRPRLWRARRRKAHHADIAELIGIFKGGGGGRIILSRLKRNDEAQGGSSPAVILTVMICALSINAVMPAALPKAPASSSSNLNRPLNWEASSALAAAAGGASGDLQPPGPGPRAIMINGAEPETPRATLKRSLLSHEEPGMEALAGLVNDANEQPSNTTTQLQLQQANSGSGSRSMGQRSKQQQILEQQVYQRRRTLMELKQKYLANRAISDRAYYILLLIYSLFILFGTISNSLICLTVILRPKILSPRNIFIVNLAGSDLLLCVFTMPFSFIEISMKMWQMGLLPCKLVAGLQATSIFVSTISITAIALDRYRVIVYPTHQEASTNNSRSAALMLALVWLVALLLSLPLFSFRTVEHMELPLNHDTIKSVDFCVEAWPFAHGRGIYSVISMIFQYVLPITIVSVVYAKISDKLQKRLIRRQRLTQLECQQKKQLNLIKRTHTMLVSVSLIFGLSWLPLNLLNLIGDFSDLFGGNDQLFRIVFAICHLIGCSSACTNPVLYGYLNENFRKQFKEVYSHHAHQLLRLIRRSPFGRLLLCYCCCARNLQMAAYEASSSSPSSSPSHSSASSGSSSSSSGSASSNDGVKSDESSTSRDEPLKSKAGQEQKEEELSGCEEVTTANHLFQAEAANMTQNQQAKPPPDGSRLVDGNPEQAIRKFSFQALTGSKQRLDRTMRFCLCLSTMTSSTESFQNGEENSRQGSIKRRAGRLTTGHSMKRSSSKIKLETLRRAENNTSFAGGEPRSLPNGTGSAGAGSMMRKRKKKKRRRSSRRKECECDCHRRKSCGAALPADQKLVDKPPTTPPATSQMSGRRVWLRFFPTERLCKISGSDEQNKKQECGQSDEREPIGERGHCANCKRASGRRRGRKSAGSRNRKSEATPTSNLKSRSDSSKRQSGKSKTGSSGQSPAVAAAGGGVSAEAKGMSPSGSGPALQGIPLTTGDEPDEDEVEEGANVEIKSRDQSSSSASRKERARLMTGRYYLSVETARRKFSADQTSSSRERTSTSVLITNCSGELDSQAGAESQLESREVEGSPAAFEETEINLSGSGGPIHNAAANSPEVSLSPGGGVDDQKEVEAKDEGERAGRQVHVIRTFNPSPIKQAPEGCALNAAEVCEAESGRPTVKLGPEKSEADKQPTNNNSNSNSSTASSFGCLSSTCSCSLSHSSNSLSCRDELGRANRKCPLPGSSSLAGGELDVTSVAKLLREDGQEAGPSEKLAAIPQAEAATTITTTTTATATTTCSLTCSSHTTNATSRRSSLNSNSEFACSSSNAPSLASSSTETSNVCLQARIASSGNPLNQAPDGRKLTATTSEQISVNKSEPRLNNNNNNNQHQQQQNGCNNNNNNPRAHSKFLPNSKDTPTTDKASSWLPAGRPRSGSEVPRRSSLARIRLNIQNNKDNHDYGC